MTIGERIRQRRIELGLSQEELAHRMGNKSRASICTVENDKEDLTTTRIRKFAEALECSPGYLMGWEDDGIPTVVRKVPADTVQIERYDGLSEKNMKEAMELYQKYMNAIPEIRDAVARLLKSGEQDS